jgi:hypothetical protein
MAEEERNETKEFETQPPAPSKPSTRDRQSIERKTVIVAAILISLAVSYLVTTAIGVFIRRICLFSSVEQAFLILVLVVSRIIGFAQVRIEVQRAITSMDTAVFGDQAVISNFLPNILTPKITFCITAVMIVRFFVRLLSFLVWGLLVAETLVEMIFISAAILYMCIWYGARYIKSYHPDWIRSATDGEQKNVAV